MAEFENRCNANIEFDIILKAIQRYVIMMDVLAAYNIIHMRALSQILLRTGSFKPHIILTRSKIPDQPPSSSNQSKHTKEHISSPKLDVNIDSVKQQWDHLSDMYASLDASPQTYFFTLLNMLRIRKASNILEIACGGGLLLPYVIDQKRPECQYVATDLSSAMIKKTYQRMNSHFSKYKSKLTLEEWLKEQNMIIQQANGEEPVKGFNSFDIVICNLVLMLTINPKSILQSAYEVSSKNATMGITIWGNRQRSNFLTLYSRAIKSLNLPIVKPITPFDYQDKIKQDLKETGWKIKFQWEQNSPFHFAGEIEEIDEYLSSVYKGEEDYSKQDLQKIKLRMRELYLDTIAKKAPLEMSSKLFIVQK